MIPPATEEKKPLAVLPLPPLTEDEARLAVLFLPPLTEEKLSLAVLSLPPNRGKPSADLIKGTIQDRLIGRYGRSVERRRHRVEQGSGNVFRDLGFPHPDREQLKADLTLQIYRLVRQRGLTQAEAGEILGIRQPHVSALMRGRSGAFSIERLMQFLTALGQDVEVTVRSARKRRGELSVIVR